MSLAALRAVGAPAVLRGIKASGGRWLRQLESVEVERRVGLGVALHRASLIDILLGRLTRTQVHLGADVTTVDLNGTVHWTTQGGVTCCMPISWPRPMEWRVLFAISTGASSPGPPG